MSQHKDLHVVSVQLSNSRKRIIHLSVLGDTIVTLNILTALTRKMSGTRRFKQVYSCMELVNRLYESGNEVVKNAVGSLYINSFSLMQLSCSKEEWTLVKAVMPGSLYRAYTEQVSKSGC